MLVKVRKSQTQIESETKYPELAIKFGEFINTKTANPMQQFGGSDTSFTSGGHLAQAIPKLRHAHLNSDVSIVYKIHGNNPTFIDLYGLFSHAELGTGNPAKPKKQKNIATRLSNQIPK